MIKDHTEVKEVEEVVVDDIICNKCGKSCRENSNYQGLIEKTITGCYGSVLGDQTSITFSLCEYCLMDLFKTFAIPPEIFDYLSYDGDEITVEDLDKRIQEWKEYKQKKE